MLNNNQKKILKNMKKKKMKSMKLQIKLKFMLKEFNFHWKNNILRNRIIKKMIKKKQLIIWY
jgi:hypothetical protein